MAPSYSITPTCKYGHGAWNFVNDNGSTDQWALHSSGRAVRDLDYQVRAFVCGTCGYVELFDFDPMGTVKRGG